MTIIVLTDENLKSFKNLLKPFCADTKSSHLTEAVARGLGFKSQAALLTAVKTSKKPKLDCAVFQEATFSAWLKEKGAVVANQIPSSAYNDLDQPTFKWIESRSKADKADHTNSWFDKCRKHNLPYIYIEKKTKYCVIHWDYISVDEHHDPKKFTYDLSQKLERLVQKRHGAKGTFSLFVGSISGLGEDDAISLAEDIFLVLYDLISVDAASVKPAARSPVAQITSLPLSKDVREEFLEAANSAFETVMWRMEPNNPELTRQLWDAEDYVDNGLLAESMLPISKDYALSLIDAFLVHHVLGLAEEADKMAQQA